jgi:hypothetical protein
METSKLKEHLIHIASKVDENTRLEDIYEQLALLADIEESEDQEARGETISHEDVVKHSGEWLK